MKAELLLKESEEKEIEKRNKRREEKNASANDSAAEEYLAKVCLVVPVTVLVVDRISIFNHCHTLYIVWVICRLGRLKQNSKVTLKTLKI